MINTVVNQISFPEFLGIKCNMMSFIQGDSSSIPEEYQSYSQIVNDNYLEKGEIGFLTIDESYVEVGDSQRGFNITGVDRNVHVEVGRTHQINCWGGSSPSINTWGTPTNPNTNTWGSPKINTWGKFAKVILDDSTKVLIANSISNTCRFWDTIDKTPTLNGDLGEYLEKYPPETGVLMGKGELVKMSIFTPHECINQTESGNRQFFRIIGKGVVGREDYFTINPLME